MRFYPLKKSNTSFGYACINSYIYVHIFENKLKLITIRINLPKSTDLPGWFDWSNECSTSCSCRIEDILQLYFEFNYIG